MARMSARFRRKSLILTIAPGTIAPRAFASARRLNGLPGERVASRTSRMASREPGTTPRVPPRIGIALDNDGDYTGNYADDFFQGPGRTAGASRERSEGQKDNEICARAGEPGEGSPPDCARCILLL